jgi:transposase
VLKHPDAYQDELQAWLLDNFGIEVTRYIVSRALKRKNLTQKKLRKIAKQRNDILRAAWLVTLSDLHVKQLVFVDEIGAKPRTGERRNGWAPKGLPAIKHKVLSSVKNWSILPAYTIDGYISTVMFQGSFNGERFKDFIINYVLPCCTPFPGPRLVLVMDNASIHKTPGVVRACQEASVLLQFLLPYSPDYNPIEESFGDLKSWIRRH